ncbi:hypothetical protein PMAYCL1PPCAC_27259, partial [Pristionchus mayeri]
MTRTLLLLAGSASLATVLNGQCALGDHPNCPNWVRNGFCQSSSNALVKRYCPKSCTNAGCGGGVPGTATTTAATAKTENKNCQKWNEDPKTAFCAAMKPEQKKAFCFKTCAAEI